MNASPSSIEPSGAEEEKEAEEGEETAARSFQFAPSIAPPVPNSLAALEATRDEDARDESERRIKQEIAKSRSQGEEPSLVSRSETENDNDTDELGCGDNVVAASTSSRESRHSLAGDANGSNVSRQSQLTTSEATDDGLDAQVDLADDRRRLTSQTSQPLLQPPYDDERLVCVPEAYLVDSTVGRSLFPFRRPSNIPVAVCAEPLGPWYHRRWGRIMIGIVALLLALLLSFTGVVVNGARKQLPSPTESPSFVPSLAPSPDGRSTLEAVRERGSVRCGLKEHPMTGSFDYSAFTMDLCRAVASVVFGDPAKVESRIVENADRFVLLDGRHVDLLISSDTHTLRREVLEKSTGSGFSFTMPYLYTGAVYLGQREYVECAEDQIRYGEFCSDLKICVVNSTTELETLELMFPPSYLRVVSSSQDLAEGIDNGAWCNVIAHGVYQLLELQPLYDGIQSGKYTFGNVSLSNEPIAIVTRRSDQQWSHICQGVMRGLLRGIGAKVTEDASRCPVGASNALNISFLNAPLCVGNFLDIIERTFPPALAVVNSLTENITRLIGAAPFGSLTCPGCLHSTEAMEAGTALKDIFQREELRCGVVVHPENQGLTSMNEIYCSAVAAAIFQGDAKLVNVTRIDHFDESSLRPGAFDIIAGGWPDLSDWSPEIPGELAFSVPYYYERLGDGNGRNDQVISLVTRGSDPLFSSFVNAVITATIYAVQNGISRELNSELMPFIDIFGGHCRWMLKDVISSSGSYDEIYYDSHGQVADRGFNRVIVGRNQVRIQTVLCKINGSC